MLSFEHKCSILRSIDGIVEKPRQDGRIDFIYSKSRQKGKIIATQLHPSGNGYVLGKYMNPATLEERHYQIDISGWIKIKDFTEASLLQIIKDAMYSMSGTTGESPEFLQKDTNSNRSVVPPIESGSTPVRTDLSQEFEKEEPPYVFVEKCLYNWLGYGNLNAPIWFIGMEEGGAEIWRMKTTTLEESLAIRSTFQLSMDFHYVWEELFAINIDSFKGANVWRYLAAFLLEWEGRPASPEAIRAFLYESKELGKSEGNHFHGEFMPLPKPSKASIYPYESIWKTNKAYEDALSPQRFQLILEALRHHEHVKLIVSYDRHLTEIFLAEFKPFILDETTWQFANEHFTLYMIRLSNTRKIAFLSTPFFGNGRISYSGIRDAANRVREILLQE